MSLPGYMRHTHASLNRANLPCDCNRCAGRHRHRPPSDSADSIPRSSQSLRSSSALSDSADSIPRSSQSLCSSSALSDASSTAIANDDDMTSNEREQLTSINPQTILEGTAEEEPSVTVPHHRNQVTARRPRTTNGNVDIVVGRSRSPRPGEVALGSVPVIAWFGRRHTTRTHG